MIGQRALMSSGSKGYDSFTKSMLHFNSASTLDEIGKVWTPNGGIGYATGKFGTAIQFSGSQWIDTPDHVDFTLGNGDFTIDFWIKRGTTGTTQYIFGQSDSTPDNASISLYGEFGLDGIVIITYCISGYNFNTISASQIVDTTTWHHLAMVRNSASINLYIDGVVQGSGASVSTLSVTDSSNKFTIGRLGEYSGSYFNGYIDEFRLSKGIARWTANFTPPTAPY